MALILFELMMLVPQILHQGQSFEDELEVCYAYPGRIVCNVQVCVCVCVCGVWCVVCVCVCYHMVFVPISGH